MPGKCQFFLVIIFSAAVLGGHNGLFADFDSDLKNARKIGYDTAHFSHKTSNFTADEKETWLLFPHNGDGTKIWADLKVTVLDEAVPPVGAVFVTNTGKVLKMRIRFPMAATYKLSLTLWAAGNKKWSYLTYTIDAGEDAVCDEFGVPRNDNLPVFPNGNLYGAGLTMKQISQKYLFHSVKREWSVTLDGGLRTNIRWIVSRSGLAFNTNNITAVVNPDSVTYHVRFPENGVYVADLKNLKGVVLVRYKVRCLEPSPDAVTNTPRKWPDKSQMSVSYPDLQRRLWVLDIPFDWEMSVQTLAARLKEKAKSDEELYEMFYDWVTQNIYYDYFYFDINGNRLDRSGAVFPSITRVQNMTNLCLRGGICEDFSETMNDLCAFAGLDSYIVVGNMLSGKGGKPGWESHAWNAAKINGEWKFLDTTWGIFLKSPEDFFYSRKVDLISRLDIDKFKPVITRETNAEVPELFGKLGKQEVLEMPNIPVYVYFKEMGFSLDGLSHRQFSFQSGKSFTMEFEAPEGYDLKVTAQNKSDSKRIKPEPAAGYKNGKYTVRFDFQKEGVYRLKFEFFTKEGPLLYTEIGYEAVVR